jgi:hypothetical protein
VPERVERTKRTSAEKEEGKKGGGPEAWLPSTTVHRVCINSIIANGIRDMTDFGK